MKKNNLPVAVLTGASGGLGRSIAGLLSADGYFVVLCGRNSASLYSIKKTIGPSAVVVSDLSLKSGTAAIIRKFPRADVLINNAGFSEYIPLHMQKPANIEKILMVNALSPALLTRHYTGEMLKKNRGMVLNIASTAGSFPTPYMSVYGGAKSFLISFSEAVSLELKGTGVSVTCVLPGPIDTGFWETAGAAGKVKGTRQKFDTPEFIAAEAYAAMKAGRAIVIAGLTNKTKNLVKKSLPPFIRNEMIRNHMLENCPPWGYTGKHKRR